MQGTAQHGLEKGHCGPAETCSQRQELAAWWPSHLAEPSLPINYATLSSQEKLEADELYRQRLLFYYYHIFNGHYNKLHLEALRDPLFTPRQHLVDRAGRQWNGNLITLKGALTRMVEYWPHLPDTKGYNCPVQFSSSELKDFYDQEQT